MGTGGPFLEAKA